MLAIRGENPLTQQSTFQEHLDHVEHWTEISSVFPHRRGV